MEVGPFRVSEDASALLYRKEQYFQKASFLFVDQPLRTGLSYVANNNGLLTSFQQVHNTSRDHRT